MDNIREQYVVDSAMTEGEILTQNPQRPAPKEVLNSITTEEVRYLGFDGKIHIGQIAMHQAVMADIRRFFQLALALKFPIKKVIPISNSRYHWDDKISCDDNNSSGYNYRLIAGTDRISKHARGLAFDINPIQNVFIRYNDQLRELFRSPKAGSYDISVPGTLTTDQSLVLEMKKLGWMWGGDWTPASGRVDYQHFEKDI